ncbi:hypothetical protein [Methylobacterium sp. AMS5]|uniref:hypothetical protein n=1 Tax=Methylobacterium sp. AMS5 TaxID=925818 RepID=UPI00074F8EF9|nr:hypothetical protein [Methylobacterium sp. AMS5]AMB45081.1 hypothetical protein Y590_09235 [Methylobacterium sp. AMS5]
MIRARRLVARLEAEEASALDDPTRHWFRRACTAGFVADELARTPFLDRHPLVAQAAQLRARLLKIKHHACSMIPRDLATKDLSAIREW